MTAFLLISTGILLLIAVPIGMAMGTASLLTILQGGTLNALIITQKLLSGVSKFSLLAIPMFTLAGEVMTLGGVSDKLIYLANRVVGRFKGGLSMVTTLACMFFGAISGSATATAAAIGGIMVEPMEKAGYKKEYTAAVIASSGLLGLIIPPSRCLRPGDVHRRYHPRHHHGPQPYGRRVLPRQEKRLRHLRAGYR